jgi:AcrR family transcriptional regulator
VDREPLTRRERQAQQTRREILQAARTLFAERGYTRTSVRDIAVAAGVSAQTVYDSIGSKQAVVARLNDLIDEEAGVGSIVRESIASHDPVVVATTAARVTRAILERCGDIVRALVTGADAEPELDDALGEGHRRHVEGARAMVRVLDEAGALRHGLDPDEAAETMAALADFSFGLMLRDRYGWSLDRIENWMADSTRALLLA